MPYIREDVIEFGTMPMVIEQKIKAGEDFTGTIPTLSTEPVGERDFVPFYEESTGIFKMGNPGPTTAEATLFEGDAGGLFTFQHKRPIIIDHIMANFGTAIAHAFNLVTANGSFPLLAATAITAWFKPSDKLIIFPGESIKITTTSATAAMWARVIGRIAPSGG